MRQTGGVVIVTKYFNSAGSAVKKLGYDPLPDIDDMPLAFIISADGRWSGVVDSLRLKPIVPVGTDA
jgi:hypothetical protein